MPSRLDFKDLDFGPINFRRKTKSPADDIQAAIAATWNNTTTSKNSKLSTSKNTIASMRSLSEIHKIAQEKDLSST